MSPSGVAQSLDDLTRTHLLHRPGRWAFPCSVTYFPDGNLLATGSGYLVDEYGPGEVHVGAVKLRNAEMGLEVRALRSLMRERFAIVEDEPALA